MKMRRSFIFDSFIIIVGTTIGAIVLFFGIKKESPAAREISLRYQPRNLSIDASGFGLVNSSIPPWNASSSLQQLSDLWRQPGFRLVERFDRDLASNRLLEDDRTQCLLAKATVLSSEGEARRAYRVLEEARTRVEAVEKLAQMYRFTIVYLQGVTALRIGENENCILCRGESSCILPIAPSAVHCHPEGSRLAIRHFCEYLDQFPHDLEVRWLLNLAHMTLGEYPHKVDPAHLVNMDRFFESEFNIGKFRDIGHLVGVNRFNQAGGAIMDDFDNDGLLDLVVTSYDPTEPMGFYRNRGDGTFEESAVKAGLGDQLGGLQCMQCDYNNDGLLDIFVCRGAWLSYPIRPSLLRNNGDGTFTDVTAQAKLDAPLNSNAAAWADYDNDGFVDLFVCCERQPNRLYRNQGDGTFAEVAARANVADIGRFCKGAAWIDYDNDDYPDLFVNNLGGDAQLYHNNRDGTFREVTVSQGIDGPTRGFSCWAWDYDNDGWLDIFATNYEGTTGDVVKGLLKRPTMTKSSKLYRNLGGKGFRDVTKETGLDKVFLCMGSNFADLDNDGYLDFYLGTGAPSFSTLVPNRLYKNVGGRRFADISSSSGTGHLQKGHGVAIGDWDRDGNLDLFIQMGGAVNGDKYHNILFQNPGQGNHWLTVKLIGQKTNRAAVGARIKAVAAGKEPLTIHRHVSSGSSFGANPYEQTLGLAQAERVAILEIHWPTSGTTQVFRDIAVDRAIEITEFADTYRELKWKKISVPK